MKKTSNYTFQHEVESSEKTHFFFQKEPVLFPVPSFHNSYEFIYLLEGEAEVVISGKKHTLSEGDICIVPPNHVHYYKTFGKNVLAYVLVVGHNYSHHLRAVYPNLSFELVSKDAQKNGEIKALLDEWFSKKGGPLVHFGYVNLLFDKCANLFAHINTQNEAPFENLAVRFIDYLQAHYKERITLESVAKHFGYSKIYFCALFKGLVGSTFLDVLNNIRMEKAVELMHENHDKISIEQVCEECGFTSISTFYRLYRKYTQNS